MIDIVRTNSESIDFTELIKNLDSDLAEREMERTILFIISLLKLTKLNMSLLPIRMEFL